MRFHQAAIALACSFAAAFANVAPADAAQPTLRVIKRVSPVSDPGKFNLRIDGVVRAANVGDSGTTGFVTLEPGSHMVSETAGLSTSLSNYLRTITGDCSPAGHIVLVAGDHKTCTITNARLGTLKIIKKVIPASNPGKFNLTIDGHVYVDNVGDGGTTGPVPVQPGSHSVGETAGTAAILFNYTTTYSGGCDSNGHVTVPLGVNKTCTITNKLKSWTARLAMPTARLYFAIGVIGHNIYVAGGQSGSAFNKLERYNTISNTWLQRASLQNHVRGLAGAAVNGLFYVTGGRIQASAISDPATPDVWAYNPTTNAWTPRAPMLAARAGHAVAVLNGILYVAGGESSNSTPMASVYAYDPIANSWSTKTSMLTARTGLALVALNGKLYAMGGEIPSGGEVNTMERYDPVTDHWTPVPHMLTARQGVTAAIANGILYAVGGELGPSVFDKAEAYNPATNSWSLVPHMITKRSFGGLAAVSNILYAIGGYTSAFDPGNTTEAYGP